MQVQTRRVRSTWGSRLGHASPCTSSRKRKKLPCVVLWSTKEQPLQFIFCKLKLGADNVCKRVRSEPEISIVKWLLIIIPGEKSKTGWCILDFLAIGTETYDPAFSWLVLGLPRRGVVARCCQRRDQIRFVGRHWRWGAAVAYWVLCSY